MRTNHCFHLVPVLAGAALAACTGDPLSVAATFEVTATLSFTGDDPSYDPYPDTMSFVLYLEDAPDGTVAAMFTNGRSTDQGVFDRGSALSLREPVRLSVSFGDYDPFGGRPYIDFESLRLSLKDRDGDGDADAVSGSGSGVLRYVAGDVPYDGEFTLELRGELDATPPEITVAGNDDALHVLDGLRIVASESLLPGTTVSARFGDTRIELAPSPADASYVSSFATSAVLPFGAELRIEFDPEPRNLAGVPAESLPETVRTMPDPGAFAQDGFESDPVAKLGGGTIVTGVGTLPAIAGERSLLIGPSNELTMRIPLSGGETRLRFQARYLYESSGGCPTTEMRIGAPGAQALRSVSLSLPYDPTEDTGDASWPTAGPVDSVSVELPEGATGHVVFDVYATPPVSPPCGAAALLIDDLRVE